MVKFKRIFWKNFLSTGNAGNEIQLDKVPNTIIIGKNGHGKCLRENSEIDIDFVSDDCEQAFREFLKNK